MSLTWTQYALRIAAMTGLGQSDADWVSLIPAMIDTAEQRCYRDLDLLNTVVRDVSSSLTTNSRNYTLSSSMGRFVVTNAINYFTPVGTTATRNQMMPVSLPMLDMYWPSETVSTIPSLPLYYAMVSDQQVVVGPPPDKAYNVEVIGTIRPNPLSAINSTTYLSLYLPDLFVAASMSFLSGYYKDFPNKGDPSMPQNWETEYMKLFASANIEEQRKRYAAGGWSSMQPSPIVTPART